MTREIKFRAWYKEDNERMMPQMLEVTLINWMSPMGKIRAASCPYDIFLEEVKLLQYSGRKDKKGKEIYEGDILQEDDFKTSPHDDDSRVISIREPVVFDGGSFKMGYASFKEHRVEVIGNIYENPELLS